MIDGMKNVGAREDAAMEGCMLQVDDMLTRWYTLHEMQNVNSLT